MPDQIQEIEKNNIYDFEKCLKLSQDPLVMKEWELKLPKLFQKLFPNQEIKEIAFFDDLKDQILYHLDGILIFKNGLRYTFDIKTRHSRYYNNNYYLIEYMHNKYLFYDPIIKYDVFLEQTKGWLSHCSELIIFGTLFPDKKIREFLLFSTEKMKDERKYNELFDDKPAIPVGPTPFISTDKKTTIYQETWNYQVTRQFLKENCQYYYWWKLKNE